MTGRGPFSGVYPPVVEGKSLARLLDLNATKLEWPKGDFGGMFRHQLAALLRYDLVEAGLMGEGELGLLCAEGRIESFADLLGAEAPPVAILQAVKTYAKLNSDRTDRQMPHGVATALYFAALAAAKVRCAVSITTLSEVEMRAGMTWALRMEWVGEPVRGLLEQAIRG